NGDATTCVAGSCVEACSLQTCPTGFLCYGPDGQCHPDNCETFPDRCGADQLCVGGQCIDNTCANVGCPTDQYCVDGACHGSCAGVDCPAGQSCQLGTCMPDPCGQLCPIGTFCDNGNCVASECAGTQCPVGEWCDPSTGGCTQDPCLDVTCPG